jgi:transposase
MARYKEYCYEQTKLIPVSYDKQIVPGTFEYALNTIIDEMDLTRFEDRYGNDATGAPAYDPAILLKVILFAYSRGMVTSRIIAQACVENVTFMALSADTRPHFTTIANFVSSLKDEIAQLFGAVLTVCASEGLIGRNMFAVDGCKISSNCSKEWSGSRAGFEKKQQKLEQSIQLLVRKHHALDERDSESKEILATERESLRRLRSKTSRIREWLKNNDDKRGPSGGIKQSNLVDNESAKMPTSHGVIQGYNGVAMTDSKHQIVVAAEAFGEGQENGLLLPMVEATRKTFESIGEKKDVFEDVKLLADAGYHSEKNMEHLFTQGIDAYVADNKFRKRDPRFAEAAAHKRPIDRLKMRRKKRWFTPGDFALAADGRKLICPAGNQLYVQNANYRSNDGMRGTRYLGWKTKCRVCELRTKCMRGSKAEMRSVVLFRSKIGVSGAYTKRMIEKFDTAKGRFAYSRRMGIVEPVFAHIRHRLGLDRFTLRGRTKVDIQWKLYCIVHNIFKLYRYAPGFAS